VFGLCVREGGYNKIIKCSDQFSRHFRPFSALFVYKEKEKIIEPQGAGGFPQICFNQNFIIFVNSNPMQNFSTLNKTIWEKSNGSRRKRKKLLKLDT
jgi:hypothetical protein